MEEVEYVAFELYYTTAEMEDMSWTLPTTLTPTCPNPVTLQ